MSKYANLHRKSKDDLIALINELRENVEKEFDVSLTVNFRLTDEIDNINTVVENLVNVMADRLAAEVPTINAIDVEVACIEDEDGERHDV